MSDEHESEVVDVSSARDVYLAVAANEKPALKPELIAELKSKHGSELTSITAPNGEHLVFRKPKRQEWMEFVDGCAKDRNSKHLCMERLALSCVVHPQQEAAAAVMREYPGLTVTASGLVSRMSGSGDESEYDVKKL